MSLRSWFYRSCHLGLLGLLILVGAIGIEGGDRTSAQVTPDPSLGTKVEPTNDGNYQITGGTEVGGRNLFHSFNRFDVPDGESASFLNGPTIVNIFSRVTGGNPSNIQGMISAQGKANLFLINPNGIIFGANATLNIPGSFIATTANAIQFTGGAEFSMTSPVNPLNPLLSVNPSAFLFNQISQPIKSIQVNEATLSVPESQSLVLLGGDVNLEAATLEAPDGRVELGGLAEVGTVGLNIDNNNFRLSFPESVARADVSLTNLAAVTASGEGGGSIQVQGRRVTLAAGSSLEVNTLVSKPGGTLVVNASESVQLLGGSSVVTDTEASGSAGDLRIETGRLIVQDGSQISASTSEQSTGGGGTLFVNARDSIQLIGISPANDPSALFTVTRGAGNAGELKIKTGQLIIQDGAQVSANTRSQGDGGTLSVTADSIQLIGTQGESRSGLFVGTQGTGNAGNLNIETGQLIVQNGARISASTSEGSTGGGGTLSVKARDSIQLIGTQGESRSDLFVGTQGTGNAGNLNIETGKLIVQDGAQVSASTSEGSTGGGGTVSINARDSIQLIGTQGDNRSGLFVGTEGTGNAGNLNIETGQLIVQDGAQVSANTRSQGGGGTLSVTADSIQLIGTSQMGSSGLFVGTESTGNAGNLNIETGKLIVQDGAQVSASTSEGSTGGGGTVSVKARDSIQLIGTQGDNRSGLFVGTEGTGNAGNLNIETGQLIVQDGAQVSANTRSQGGGGTLSVTADSIQLIGTSQMGSSGLFVGTQGTGNAGNLNIETGKLIVQDGAQVSASTSEGSTGGGGTVSINARDSIQLIGTQGDNRSGLFVGTQGTGNAGNLNIETGQLIVQDGAQVSANTRSQGDGGTLSVTADSIQLIGTSQMGSSGLFVGTESTGNAGNLNIETGKLIVQDGAQVSASTSEGSTGGGGTLSVNARDSIQLIGTQGESRSGLFVGTQGTGNAGNLNIETGQLIVQDGAQVSASTSKESTGEGGSIIVNTGELNVLNNADITVSSQGTKKAGDLEITARSIKLDNQGKLIGQANSGDGGSITLNLQHLLLLRGNSEISTSAGTSGAGGNGGNITINVPDGFIIAKPNENSDITANAFSGSGGRVTIKATKIFGIAPLTEEDLKRLRPTDLDPRQLQTNDITAISQTRPDLSGIVAINTLDVDPYQGLINLPAVPVDTKVSQVCQVRAGENQNSFTIAGRGGLPPNPRTEPLTPDAVQLDWVTLNPKGENRVSTNSNQANSSSSAPIVEAQGWVINAKGEVVLTADAPTALPHSSWQNPANCRNDF